MWVAGTPSEDIFRSIFIFPDHYSAYRHRIFAVDQSVFLSLAASFFTVGQLPQEMVGQRHRTGCDAATGRTACVRVVRNICRFF